MKTKILFLLGLFFILVHSSNSQELPRYMTESEKAAYPQYLESVKSKGTVTPPGGNVRTAAEWEEMQGIVISWQRYSDVLTEIVRYAKDEGDVYIVTENPGDVENTLTDAGISLANIYFLEEPSNSVWIRDYGPNSIYKDTVGELAFVDWIYNRPRPADDTIPSPLSRMMNIPLYETTQSPYDLVQPGGNFMSDGFGTAFSSKLVLDENPGHTEAEVDQIVHDFMGIDRYIKMETLPYDGIHHIDMHMKLLDEETLLVGQYPEGVSDGPQIEANLEYVLNNYKSVFGTPYRVVRIPMPADNGYYPSDGANYLTYTNSLIINKTILVPTYGISTDTIALNIYKEAMPGYRVVGINSSTVIPASGAIHCITHELAANDPLLISHQRLRDDTIADQDTVSAKIFHHSGITAATIYFKEALNDSYQSEPMYKSTEQDNTWEYVFTDSTDKEIYYYIEATASTGKKQVRPMPAPEGYWKYHNMSDHIFADAGEDQIVTGNDSIFLDGSGSYSPSGESISYSWESLSGIELNDTTLVNPVFQAPINVERDTFLFSLQVMTLTDTSQADTVQVIVEPNVAPVADAGQDMVRMKGAIIPLKGGESYDDNGQSLSYQWQSPDNVTIYDADSSHAWCYFPFDGDQNMYSFVLTVNDGLEDSEKDTVHVGLKQSYPLPFKQDFETLQQYPEDYRLFNGDKRIPDGGSNFAFYAEYAWGFATLSTLEGHRFASAYSYYKPEGAADDWLMLPRIKLSKNTRLSWDALSFTTSGDFPDDYEVYVTRTLQDTAGFYDGKRIYYVNDESWRPEAEKPGEGMAHHEVNLADHGFVSEEVYIAFRLMTPHPGGYMLGIDEISLEPLNELVFDIRSETGAVEGAQIIIAGDTLTANTTGKDTALLVNGTYDFTVYADGYEQYFDQVNLNSQDSVVTIKLTTVPVTGITNSEGKPFHIYPNPAQKRITVSFKPAEKMDLTLFDMYGRKIQSHHNIWSGESIDISKLAPGTYILQIRHNSIIQRTRFIKYD